MLDFDSDADIFLDEFATTATVHDIDIQVLFDVDNGENMLQPIIHAKTSEITPITKGMSIIIDSSTYGVLSWYDLNGMTVLSCNKEQF